MTSLSLALTGASSALVNEASGVDLTSVSIANGDLSLEAAGAITDSGTIAVSGLASLTGTTITLGTTRGRRPTSDR